MTRFASTQPFRIGTARGAPTQARRAPIGHSEDCGPARSREPSPSALRWLLLFRLVLVVGLILSFSPEIIAPEITSAQADTAWWILILYSASVLLSGLGLLGRWPSARSQVHLAIYVDIIALTLLIHVAGTLVGGLHTLMALVVAVGALLMEGRLALLFAAFATLALLTERIYTDLQHPLASSNFTEAGLLGATFFAVTLLAHAIHRRIQEAETIAARRTVDLANLAQLNAFIIENLTTGVLVIDGEQRVRLINKAALTLLHAETRRKRMRLSRLAPGLATWIEREMEDPSPDGRVVQIGPRALRASLKPLDDSPAAGGLIYLRDMQELTREAQRTKLAALGTLTASIAHNIRNPLSAITHASQLLAEGQTLNADDRHLLEIIERNSARIDETVRSVLQLSSRDKLEPIAIDLSTWLPERVAELHETHRLAAVSCRLELAATPPPIEADPRHLHQILANLVENALVHGRDADQPARVTIRLTVHDGADERPVIEVRDQGRGIEARIAHEIFNPFFTTRTGGTGLGLYIARELAETNGITLEYEPILPRGSCFRLVPRQAPDLA